MVTTNTPIVLPDNPEVNESVTVTLQPEDLTVRFVWTGTDENDETDFWRVFGDFSYGNKFDDLYVSKSGDKMSGFLVNLDKKLVEYDPNGSSPLNPLEDSGEFVSLLAHFDLNGLKVFGSFGIEDNKPLTNEDGPVIIRNEAVIGGSVAVGGLIQVLRHPFVEGGEVGEHVQYSYQWQRCTDTSYRAVKLRSRDTTVVAKAEIQSQGAGPYSTGDYNTTPTNPASTGAGCVVTVDGIDEFGLVSSFTIKSNGTGYKSAEILTLDGTDIQIMVTDTIILGANEGEPGPNAACWGVNDDIDPNNRYFHQNTEDDVGGYIRCKITCTVGSETPGFSYSNPIGIIS